jgi:starch-binding outer membrane protein, SusD/RagB family
MNYKKDVMKHYCSIIILGLLFQTVSCSKKFLDVPILPSSIVTEVYVVDLQSAEELLNGTYIKLSRDFYKSYNLIYPDLAADNIKPSTGVSSYFPHYSWAQMPDESNTATNNLNETWMYGYNIIRDCNYLIENVDRLRDEDTIKANNIKGQAYAIRALIHHNLVNVFAQPYKYTSEASHDGIPYVLSSDQTILVSRQSVAEVYSNVISDLKTAIALLPASTANKAFISRNAAKAILARIYLFKGDYELAKDYSVEISLAIPIMTGTNYPGKLCGPQDTESIFWMPPSGTNYSTDFQAVYFSALANYRFSATSDLANIVYERPNDLRKSWFNYSGGKWQITKFPKGVVSGTFSAPEWAYYQTIIRSSEMILTAAESYAKIGKEDSARKYLDVIRRRADNAALASIASGSALLDSIYKERRKELCFEGLRLYDLLRLGQGITRIDFTSPASALLSYPNNKAVAPIPVIDVDHYPIPQNPGY